MAMRCFAVFMIRSVVFEENVIAWQRGNGPSGSVRKVVVRWL